MGYITPKVDKGEKIGDATHRYSEGHIFELHADQLGQGLNLNSQTLSGNATLSGTITFTSAVVLGAGLAAGNLTITGNLSVQQTAANDCVHTIKAGDAKDAILRLSADRGDDAGDKWQLLADHTTNSLFFQSDVAIKDTFVTKATLTTAGNLTLVGSLTVVGITSTGDINLNNVKFYGETDDDSQIFSGCLLDDRVRYGGDVAVFFANSLDSASDPGSAQNDIGFQAVFYQETALTNVTGSGFVADIDHNSNYNAHGLWIRRVVNTGTGKAAGIYISDDLASTGGTAYPICSLATELSLFSGDLAIVAAKNLILDGETGNVRLVWNNGDSRLEFYIGGNLAGYVNEATGFVNV